MMLVLFMGCGQLILGAEPLAWTQVVTDSLDGAQIIDARDAEDFEAGHVPGAHNVHWTQLTGFDDSGLWAELPPEEVGQILAEAGIRSDEAIVIYGGGIDGWGDDGNLYWSLRHVGHADIRVYNGGWSAWLAQANSPSTAPQDTSSGSYEVRPNPEVLATTEEVEDWSGVLLDVRSLEEWEDGRIPSATWMEWTDVFADGDVLLPEDEVRALLEQHGITDDSEVITYCQAGIRAGHTFMVLDALGLPGVKNYVGSWARWTGEDGVEETD